MAQLNIISGITPIVFMDKFFDDKTRQAIRDATLACKTKREVAIGKKGISEDEYKNTVSKIRGKVFDEFEKNLVIAKKNLQKNGFFVYEAGSGNEAREILSKILESSRKVVKSKTNTAREVGLNAIVKDYSETDLGDFIVELFEEEDQHYVLPAIHITAKMISEKIMQKYGDEVEPEPAKLTHYLCGKIREKILSADTGITGANFFTKTGQVVLLENEGNISLVSRLPRKHIVLAGIDKLADSVEDCVELCRAAAIFGTGQDITQYISIISGPSKTADIENKLVLGAQGAREVHIVLLDNGRRRMLEEGFGDLLRCINCGACINFCPVYNQEGSRYGGWEYIGSKGIVTSVFGESKGLRNSDGGGGRVKSLEKARQKGSFHCTLCGNCKENCPMEIPLDEMVRNIRKMQNKKGLQTKANKEMIEKTKKHGNPFGKEDKEKVSGEMYCC